MSARSIPPSPRSRIERVDSDHAETVRFRLLEAGAKLLSGNNRELLRLIATREPKSVSELADRLTAPQNAAAAFGL